MKKRNIILTLGLVAVIFSISILNGRKTLVFVQHFLITLKNGESISQAIDKFEEEYKNGISENRYWANAFGIIQNVLGKKEIKNFKIIRDTTGSLYMQTSLLPAEKINLAVANIAEIYKKTKALEKDFLFVQMPYKNFSKKKELEGYGYDYTEKNFDLILEGLIKNEVPIYDLRKEQYEWTFYKTDHHWTVESAFEATGYIVNELIKRYSTDLDTEFSEKNKFDVIEYKNALLGSAGVQVGEYYSGMDNFSMFIPKFKTAFKYEHYVSGELSGKYEGDFINSFVSKELLDNPAYYNKYNACLRGGWNENRVENSLAANNLKCLFISNSYGRPLVQYLSLYFKETRYLDPQPGRYNDSYLKYIEVFQPDIVIVMYDNEININY